MSDPIGWQCPGCARVYAPSVALCGWCGQPMAIQRGWDRLTPQERRVASLLDRETKEIAAALHVSPSTVKNQIHAILGKLRTTSRWAAWRALGLPAFPVRPCDTEP